MTALDTAFAATALVAVAAGLLAVTTRQVVHAALWLVVTLGALAGCYLVLGAELVALVQLLVYVGAVVVLVLFALMLTRAPIGRGAAHSTSRAAAGRRRGRRRAPPRCSAACWSPLAGRRCGATTRRTQVATALFGSWVWPFELLSLLLLVALVAAFAVSRMPAPARAGAPGRRMIHLALPFPLVAILAGPASTASPGATRCSC